MNDSNLTYKKIFVFWVPLAATWLMMSVEGPLIAAVIARMADAKFNLAAYGVAFSLALIAEAPIIMIMSASTALVKDRDSYYKLRNFTYTLNIILTLIVGICLIPEIFYFLTQTLIGLPDRIADLTYKAVFLLLPWPAAIGYRRFFHGILIKNGLTKRVAYTTVTRVITMSVTAFGLFVYSNFDGVVVGASALSAGVLIEALASRVLVSNTVKKIKAINGNDELDFFSISKFYYPLALTALLSLGVHPVVTFFMGKSYMAIESLAVLPVVNSLVFIFRSLGLSYQEVVITLIGEKMEGYKSLRNFAVITGGIATLMLLVIAYTPLAHTWFQDVSGLTNDLAQFALLPLQIFAFIPALTFFISFERATLVFTRKTKPITVATAIEVVGIILTLFVMMNVIHIPGAVAAASAYIIGRIGSTSYLLFPFLQSIKRASRLEI